MNWKPTGIGADPKKLVILGALLVIAGYFYFSSGESGPTVSASPSTAAAVSEIQRSASRPIAKSRSVEGLNSTPKEFKPSIPKSVDPSNVDPTLHLNELAKLREVGLEGGTRSLFEIGAAPPPAEIAKLKDPAPIKPAEIFVGPKQPPPPPPPPPDPKAPPIPLKFYGFVNRNKSGSDKRAFFMDGEDIVIATEGDMIKKRYKIIRIGINSATVEDTQFKSNNQQTLPLEAEVAG